MTALRLYRFIQDNDIEWKWTHNKENFDVIIFLNLWQVEEFNNMLPETIFDDGGISCYMKQGYFAFWMQEICDHCGIDMDEVFPQSIG